MKRYLKWKVLIVLPFLLVPYLVIMLLFAGDDIANHYCPVETESESSVSSDGIVLSGNASDSDWTKKGTTANQNAEKVFKAFVDHGTSGAFASGVVGWVNSEGGFAMIGRAEGHYGNDIKTNSIAYGVRPTGLAYYTTEAGGGIFQFTPFTKYAPLGSPDWENADKMIAFVMKAVASGDWNATMDLTGKNHSFSDAVKLTDPKQATLTWQAYERGSVAHINQAQKQADAQKAYELFDGGKYQYDEAKFMSTFGKTLNGSSASIDESSVSSAAGCKVDGELSGKVSGKTTDTGHPMDIPYTISQGMHSLGAIDLAAPQGTPIYAVSDGKVVEVNRIANGINGNYVIHTLSDGSFIYYGHMRDVPMVKEGQSVKKGQQIGFVGQTGLASGPHIHFDRRVGGPWGSAGNPYELILPDGSKPVGIVVNPKTNKK
ncbi:phage tail tip lysozyme [Streptococcus pluranimalium]